MTSLTELDRIPDRERDAIRELIPLFEDRPVCLLLDTLRKTVDAYDNGTAEDYPALSMAHICMIMRTCYDVSIHETLLAFDRLVNSSIICHDDFGSEAYIMTVDMTIMFSDCETGNLIPYIVFKRYDQIEQMRMVHDVFASVGALKRWGVDDYV